MARQTHALLSLAGIAAITLAPAPARAEAQDGALANAAWAKKEAILGAPSALEAMIAKQQGIALPARGAPQPATFKLGGLQPSSVRETPIRSAAVTSGKPDVFGSVALRVGSTPLNARWLRVDHARVTGAPARYADSLIGLDKVEQLEAVNRYVNRRVRFLDDERQFGRADVWTTANQTLSAGKGDCEDYAIAKLQMLRRAGFAERDLYLVIVKDLVSRSDHAVLVVRAAGRMFVLDNGTEALLDSDSIRDYRPILTFASTGTWTHGYRVRVAPVAIASAPEVVKVSPEPARGTQRSWSASLLAFSTGLSR